MQLLPEVYQIEVTRACNYSCPMCPTQFFPREDDKQFLDVSLLDKIIAQGDLRNSYFIELQMGGEPLLHPELTEIITKLKNTGVKVGLSTNGHFIIDKMMDLMLLDAITVSVDSITNYEDIRIAKNGNNSVEQFVKDVKTLLIYASSRKIPVDLQVIELEGWEKQIQVILDTFRGFKFQLRSIPNNYVPYTEPEKGVWNSHELCINPWMSVSIQCNGNVTACCVAQGDDLVYGNLYNERLQDIWANEKVAWMRTQMRLGNYPDVCKKCYSRSPALFHQSMIRGMNK